MMMSLIRVVDAIDILISILRTAYCMMSRRDVQSEDAMFAIGKVERVHGDGGGRRGRGGHGQ